MTKKCKEMCRGCRDDFYNDHNPHGVRECWSYAKARVVRRFKLGWWTTPTTPGAFQEVETLTCHHRPGQYAFSESLPSYAVDQIMLPGRRRATATPAEKESR